jgi:hypothetical protein
MINVGATAGVTAVASIGVLTEAALLFAAR